jgi:hypothetical protein
MGVRIPDAAIVPLLIASFIMLAYQYYRVDPVSRVLNLRFALMVGAVVLIFATVGLDHSSLSLVFFLLALFWLALALYLFRMMPPPKH